MELIAVKESKSVSYIGWEKNTLAVKYVQNPTLRYEYWPVPKDVFDIIMTSTSKGHSVDALVKKFVPARYDCKKIDESKEKV